MMRAVLGRAMRTLAGAEGQFLSNAKTGVGPLVAGDGLHAFRQSRRTMISQAGAAAGFVAAAMPVLASSATAQPRSATSADPKAQGQAVAIVNSPEAMRAKWERYARAWGPVGAAERKQILHETLAGDFHYLDPRIECHGQEEVTRNLEAFQQRQPGGGFVLRDILAHHNVAMVSWQLIKKDGEAANRGHDIAVFDRTGLIKDITGFFAR